jgi:hypothetical protein
MVAERCQQRGMNVYLTDEDGDEDIVFFFILNNPWMASGDHFLAAPFTGTR